jgi:hypothetical protein
MDKCQGVQLCGRRDEQIDSAGRSMLTLLGEDILNLGCASEDPVGHRYPGERSHEEFLQLCAMFRGPSGVEQLQLDKRTGGHETSRNLLLPMTASGLVPQQPHQRTGVQQKPRRTHLR